MMQTQISYHSRFQTHLEAVQDFLDRLLTPQPPERLWQAMRHGVLNGGKRIRPVLLMETCMACGGRMASVLPTAAALELIHCYSLIHDDLPCMDNDDLRRGQPTVHKAFSEDLAVLAGDALVAMAFGIITDNTHGVPEKTILKVISDLSWAASVKGLVNGQVDDILLSHTEPNETLLYRIHQGKTAALFRFSTQAGARLAGQDASVIDALGQYGEALGLAFQMVDDLLDLHSEAGTLGKTPGKDITQGKITFPAVFGVEETKRIIRTQVEMLYGILKGLENQVHTENLKYLVQFVEEREF